MNNDDLGPKPDPVIEDKEPNPGGADAVPDNGDTLARDLDPAENPAVDDVLPEEIAAPDDKSQEPEGRPANSEAGFQDEPAAGEETEEGSVEPPQ